MLVDLHPSPTAGDGKRFRETLHRQSGDPSETKYISCPHCGFPNKSDRDVSTNTSGEGTVNVTVSQAIPSGTQTVVDPRRKSGCLFCRHDYTKSTYRQRFFSPVNMSGR